MLNAARAFIDNIHGHAGSASSAQGPAVVIDLFAPEIRRNPWPVYDQLRAESPVLRVPPPFDGWMVFDYETVKWIMTDHASFSSRIPAPNFSFIFTDPPEHTRLRNLISRAFTPRAISDLEPAIREISKQLFDNAIAADQMEFAADFSAPLAMRVIAAMMGIAPEDWPRYKGWNDKILALTFTRSGGDQARQAMSDFNSVTKEMSAYLVDSLAERRKSPRSDLLTRLLEAEVDGDRLTHEEILAFFRLLMFAGQETTTNLLNNAVLSFLDHPDELSKLRNAPQLLPSAIEEVLRYRSPFQWMMRTPLRDVEVHGTAIPKGAFVLPVVGAANRDPERFPDPHRFDIARDPNPHVAFGHGIHFCLGAALARLEARVALADLLSRFESFEYAGDEPWQPREGLIAHGPARLPIRFEVKQTESARA
jgi:cytochrome P450